MDGLPVPTPAGPDHDGSKISKMPAPGTGLIAYFNGANATDYMEWWCMMIEMAKLTDKVRARLFPMYCEP